MKGVGALLVFATGAAWGGAWVTARAAAGTAPPSWMAVGRFVFAALALFVFSFPLRQRISASHDRRTWMHLIGMALTGAIGYNLLFLLGIRLASASDGAIITPGLAGLAGVLFAFLLDRDRPRRGALFGAFVALVGVAIVGGLGHDAEGRLLGIFLLVGAAAVWGLYTVLGKRIAGHVRALEGVFWTTALGAVILTPLAWLAAGPPPSFPAVAWGNVLYLGFVATAVGFVTFYSSVRLLGVDRVAPTLGLVPVFGVAFAVTFLGEALAWNHIVGAALVVCGIFLSGRPMVPR